MNLNEIKLERVTMQTKTKLENLMNLYLHDLSEFADDLKPNEAGKFEYEGLNLYFSKEELNPFFIMCQGETAGFVLLNSGKYAGKDSDYVIHELFILKGFRKKGIASAAIENLMRIYKGKYKVEQIVSNKKAVNFWKIFYKKHNIEYEESEEVFDGIECIQQKF